MTEPMDVDAEAYRGVKRKADKDIELEPPRRIRALDQDVVNKIAAGEIIVAPVHALKELTENAVDAGSTAIEILVKDGGLKVLQITDNGHGIDRDDLPILCERFTTSKLKAFEDLNSIATYGFRGEALASISHIAHLQVTTKTAASSSAWRAHYAGGKLTPAKPGQSADPKPCAGRQGTQITVEDLFYNIPTRRRAFRSASEEYAKILDLVGRYAVHCSNVSFSCKKHGESSMGISVPATANTVERIRQIHGSGVANELLELNTSNERWGFEADGWISNANYNVKRLTLLLFINHRSVESSAIKKAIEQTYSVFLPKGGHPFVYLSLNIDPQRVDVNVHPTKREVNFLNEDEIIELICDEIRTVLGKVDTSRTFVTQSLLPGVNIPTISSNSLNATARSPSASETPGLASSSRKQSTQRTPASKPYENNLVRTDSKLRKITSMLPPAQRPASTSTSTSTVPPNPLDSDDTHGADDKNNDTTEYEYTTRTPTLCRLSTIKSLRASVRSTSHNTLTDIFATHIYVGLVDPFRRIAAIQAGVKLFLVDYGLISNEYFYQVGLTDFGNFGSIRLDPPLSLREILRIGADAERSLAAVNNADDNDDEIDWGEVVTAVEAQLLSRRDMLLEYFSLEISADGFLLGLPLLMKGYTPSLAKVPRFLLRLGPHVDWTDEQMCFHTFLRELASWYVPEPLPPSGGGGGEGAAGASGAEAEEPKDAEAAATEKLRDLTRTVENLLFPAFKARLVATKGMLKGVVEVANLKGLYRVFERC